MAANEPSQAWQAEQHQRILNKEATAFAELCEVALPHLAEFFQSGFPNIETHMREMIIIDTLLAYNANPEKYDPEKLPLFAYLRMSARGDLLNNIDKHQRREKRLVNIDAPDIQPALPQKGLLTETGELREWLQEHSSLSSHEIITLLEEELSDEDQQLLMLMLEGVRDSDQYATVMGISQLDTQAKRVEVKRAKDRLTKKLNRFGKKIGKA